jgi:hypothetical protein
MWDQSEEILTNLFRFEVFAMMSRPEKDLFLWGPAGGNKCAKKTGAVAFVALSRNKLIPPRAKNGPEFTSRG